MTFGEPAPLELLEWDLVERTGWTLDYIEGLPMARWQEWLQIMDGRGKSRNSLFNKKKK